MKLKPLSLENMETVREWRLDAPETLRTPYDLTREMQEDYYRDEICNRDSRTRYWGLWGDIDKVDVTTITDTEPTYAMVTGKDVFIGYGGIENIEWENSRGEISLLIGPDYRKQGYGTKAVEAILFKAFHFLGLRNVHGECYKSTPAIGFWEMLVARYNGISMYFPETKFYDGVYFDSCLFNFNRNAWEDSHE
jgi:RimJ/RimL family protein N-acetyltransferase